MALCQVGQKAHGLQFHFHISQSHTKWCVVTVNCCHLNIQLSTFDQNPVCNHFKHLKNQIEVTYDDWNANGVNLIWKIISIVMFQLSHFHGLCFVC